MEKGDGEGSKVLPGGGSYRLSIGTPHASRVTHAGRKLKSTGQRRIVGACNSSGTPEGAPRPPLRRGLRRRAKAEASESQLLGLKLSVLSLNNSVFS